MSISPNSLLGLHHNGHQDSAIALVSADGAPLYACSLERISRRKQDGDWPISLLAEVDWEKVSEIAVAGAARELPGAFPVPVSFVDFLSAHAAAAFWPSGFEEALCFVADVEPRGAIWGGLFEGTQKNGLRLLEKFPAADCGQISARYAFVTKLLGFVPRKHEGKITGLAALGRASADIEKLLRVDEGRPEKYKSFPPEDIAATIQAMTEKDVLALLAAHSGVSKNICLSGALFSNVRLNQKIYESGFEKIYISPPMGAEGAAYGAALHVLASRGPMAAAKQESMALGPAFDEKKIVAALEENGLSFRRLQSGAAEEIAQLLAEQKIVGLFSGRMEYGPRALGQRSILADASSKEINDRLNEKLARTEFMPFAPMTRFEDAAECYKGVAGAARAAEYMTITLACTDFMKEKCPAVVHVDGTARPQIVRKDKLPLIHAILTSYKEKTGRPAIINTSFNRHEEPIVCAPEDALKTFLAAGLDALFFDVGGGILVTRGG